MTSTTWTSQGCNARAELPNTSNNACSGPKAGSALAVPAEGLPEIHISTALLMSMFPQAPNQSCPPPFTR